MYKFKKNCWNNIKNISEKMFKFKKNCWNNNKEYFCKIKQFQKQYRNVLSGFGSGPVTEGLKSIQQLCLITRRASRDRFWQSHPAGRPPF